MSVVGWDWASQAHDVTVLDDAGAVLDRWAFPHTEAGWVMALARLRRHGEPGDLPVIIEKTSGLIVDRLLAAGHPVVPVHPTSFHAARPRWGASGAKSDPGDSYKLADYLRTDGHRLRRLEPADPGLRELQALVRLREDQVRARTAATNQLWAMLGNYWPGPRDLFCSLASAIALAFLTAYPTPQSAARLGEARMAAFLRRNSYRGGKSPALLLARLRAAPQAPLALPAATLTAMVGAHVQQLRSLQAAITGIEHLIADARRRLPPRPPAGPPARRRHHQPRPAARRSRPHPGPGHHRRAGRQRMRRRPGHPSLRQDHRRLLPLGRQHPRPQGHHRLRPQRPDAITLGGTALRRRPRPRQAQPPRHPHRRPRLDPRHLGLLAHRHPLRPRHPPRRPATPYRLRT